MKTKEVTFDVNFNSIDRVQQETISKGQLLWIEERVLKQIVGTLCNDFGFDFDLFLELSEDKNKLEVIIRQTN